MPVLSAPDDFVTDGAWGTGKGVIHTAEEADDLLFRLAAALDTAIAGVPGLGIGSIDAVDGRIVFTMDDDDPGPATTFDIGVPVVNSKYRGEYVDGITYHQGDMFRVTGVGIIFVNLTHVSPATFNLAATVSGFPAYRIVYPDNAANGVFEVTGTTYAPTDTTIGYIRTVSTDPTTVTINEDTTHILGAEMIVTQRAAGVVTIAPENGNVTINSVPGKSLDLDFEGAVIYLKKIDTNEWDTWGDYADA